MNPDLRTDSWQTVFLRKPDKDVTRLWIRGRKEETLGKLVIRPIELGRIERFTRPVLEQFSGEVMAAIEAVLADRGVTVEKTKGSFNEHEYHLSLTFRTELPDGKTPEQADFEKGAFLFGLSEADFHRPFRSHGKTYLLCGFKLKNHTYPIVGLCPRTGRKFKFGMDVLESLGKT